jgi:tRNA nucleotidyltransferase/poly(A) polymerase
MWEVIPNSIKQLHKIFKENNKSLFLVGGSVRDFLMNQTPKDFDLATDATPDEVISILEKDYRFNLQGKAFGVVVVYTEDGDFEIATFRVDQYGDKLGETRNPDVTFTTIDKDVLRRDISINGLFYDLDKKEIVDLVGGVNDIQNKIIRFIGEPVLRIEEDPLRILRAIRFSTRYKFDIEVETSKAIFENSDKLNIITKERIWEEIKKAYSQSKNFKDYTTHLYQYEINYVIFPNLYITGNHPDEKLPLELHIAYMFKDNNTNGFLDKLKFDFKIEHDFSRLVVFLIDLLNVTEENVIDLYKKKTICGISNENIELWYRINFIDNAMHKAFLQYKPCVKAEELMLQGFNGKALGLEIKRLELQNFKKILNEI